LAGQAIALPPSPTKSQGDEEATAATTATAKAAEAPRAGQAQKREQQATAATLQFAGRASGASNEAIVTEPSMACRSQLDSKASRHPLEQNSLALPFHVGFAQPGRRQTASLTRDCWQGMLQYSSGWPFHVGLPQPGRMQSGGGADAFAPCCSCSNSS